ncbi:proton-coupled amino acid transporter 3 [Phtheirospermum japonicum]|uniref:Proton-coupled amino acid transporter 3 n=1 Tax=Phtheirospermum japonicum TaxID=374723 RepID=A0A830D5C6_9LAMI|nr:proton-coupled amino acid transporter 3 [Phtheirospermum japonicum]
MGFEKRKGAAGSSTHSLPREDTPLLSVNGKPHNIALSSQPKTFANVFIAIVGAGVLGLPYTFMRTGWLTSLTTVVFVALLTYHCMMLLIHTRKKLEDSPACAFPKIVSFGDLGFAVCGSVGRFAVDSMVVLSQAGFCVGYLIFIGNTLATLFSSPSFKLMSSTPKIWGVPAKSVYIWSCFPFQLGLNSIPSLTLLAPLSIFADIVDLGAMGVVMVDDFIIFSKQMPVVEAFGTLSTFFYGLGVAVYSFEGIGMSLPLESEMKDKSKFGKILGLTMVFIAAMYGGFGAFGYFAFGDNTKDIITANMGKGLLSTLVQLGFCINLFFTFPLMMNPVYEVFERRYWDGKYCLWMRWMLVLAVSLVALFVPNFADFLSLVGSSTCCVLGFVLPSLFHYLTFKDEMSCRQASADLGIIVLGVFLGVSGTWYSLVEIFSVKV